MQTRPHAGRGLCEGGTVCGCPLRVKTGQHLSTLYRVSVPKGSPNKKDAEGADLPLRREGVV